MNLSGSFWIMKRDKKSWGTKCNFMSFYVLPHKIPCHTACYLQPNPQEVHPSITHHGRRGTSHLCLLPLFFPSHSSEVICVDEHQSANDTTWLLWHVELPKFLCQSFGRTLRDLLLPVLHHAVSQTNSNPSMNGISCLGWSSSTHSYHLQESSLLISNF